MAKTATKASSSEKNGGDQSISKIEAVRRAVKKLGGDAPAADIQKFVKKEFNLDMDLDKIYTYRWAANKEAAEASAVTKAAGKSGLMTKPAAPANGEQISRMDAVQKALAKLGNDAKPTEIKEFVQTKFGIAIETSTISNYKGDILKKAAGKSSVLRQPADSSVSRTPASLAASPSGISTSDMRTMKELLDRIGAEDAREMIDILAQ
jgi:hypothetical protein